MDKLRSPQGYKRRRKWGTFLFFVVLIDVMLFFVGLEQNELWGLVMIAGWLVWCLRK